MSGSRTFFNSILLGARILSKQNPISNSFARTSCLNRPTTFRIALHSAFPTHPTRALPRRGFHTSRPTQQRYQRFGGRNPAFGFAAGAFSRWSARPTFYYEVGGLGAAGGVFYIYNLDTVPVSGRRRFNIISDQYEEQLGKSQLQQILQQYQDSVLPDHDARVKQVRRVLERLVPQSGLLKDREWSVHVIDSEETNAFVIPGGHVFVFTGILPVCETDDGLATVLGHEIGHNVAHHIAEKMSRLGIIWVGVFALEILGLLPSDISRVLVNLCFEMPASRKQESEADYLGIMMMAESCFDPEAAVSFWDRMSQVEEKMGAPPQMLSTHPSSHNRQEKLVEWLPKAREKLDGAGCGMTRGYLREFRESYG